MNTRSFKLIPPVRTAVRNRAFRAAIIHRAAGAKLCLLLGGSLWAGTTVDPADSDPSRPAHPLPEMVGRPAGLPAPRARSGEQAYEPGEVLIKLRENSPAARALRQPGPRRAVALQELPAGDLRRQLQLAGVRQIEPVFRVAGLPQAPRVRLMGPGGKPAVDPHKREALFRWYRLRLGEGADPREAIASLKASPEVEVAEPNARCSLAGQIPPPISGLPDGTTDPGIDEQWHHTFSRTQMAWNYLKEQGVDTGGSRDVVVAVIDTGVDATHEDLAANMWTNPGEIPGNAIDDDNDGFVDDIHGCSVVAAIQSHSGESSDYHGHGTHVAGIIAATAFNGTGGVGVAFNVQVMAVRAAQYSGTLTTTDVAEGVLYAIDHGAEVISMSFGTYLRSQVIEDTLEVALSQAALIAAAGNDSLPSDLYPLYPAALPYVIGVEARTPTGNTAWFSNYGYEVGAPGESIYSTLPGDTYAKWSGTSMATPVIAGIAALMRSYYWQRDIWSVRFLMGALWASGGDAYRALTEIPAPGVTLYENWLFDDEGIAAVNDGDGRADSGETLHIGIELINRAGRADNIVATLEAQAEGVTLPDPYVTIDAGVVNFGEMGPFTRKDNGFVRNQEGVITGVADPFVFTVSPDCPNDHVIPFKLTVVFEDGWDPEHTQYTRISRFNYIVQRGKNVPTVIPAGSTVTLDPGQYWIVGGPVLIEAGATLNVLPGTQMQWGSISDDPYNPGPQNGYIVVRGNFNVAGTPESPASFFPSYLVAGQQVKITAENDGIADLSYVKVRNPDLDGLNDVDHAYFEWDAFPSKVTAIKISNSVFHKFRGGGTISSEAGFYRCLFDAGWVGPSGGVSRYEDCAFLQDNENPHPMHFHVPWSFSHNLTRELDTPDWFYHLMSANGSTYVVMPVERGGLRAAETIAQFYGGHVASIPNQAEYDLIKAWVDPMPMIANTMDMFVVGLSDMDHPGVFEWTDGAPVTIADWKTGEPQMPSWREDRSVIANEHYRGDGQNAWDWYVSIEWYRRDGAHNPEWWRHYLLRLPGDRTLPELTAPMEDGRMLTHLIDNFPPLWRHNAFLNPYWNPDLNKWMWFQGTDGDSDGHCVLRDNYLGTGSTTLIDYAVHDYYDNFNSARVDYGAPPTVGYLSTYPFAQKVEINGQDAMVVPKLGAGEAVFRITFNRDMDTSIEPFVTFGPNPPHTDFQIKARDENFIEIPSGWLDARTWEGKAWITPVTGNGYHLMRISGAVAADDPWLVSGYDVARFRFEVSTAGLESMTLSATGLEGRIDLNWLQDDYELLAGYNLYRAGSADGPFTRLNQTIIPPTVLSYVDTDVQPAVPMYYRFSVMTTDNEESDPSPTVTAAAADTIPPTLTHTPAVAALAGRGLRLTATATDNVAVTAVTLRYRARGSSDPYTLAAMINTSGDLWSATIPASVVQPPGVEYYLTASDGVNDVLSGTAATPHAVVVENQPTLASVLPSQGPATGGTSITLAGTQFQLGASVLFGAEAAVNVSVISAHQITCETPPHFPAEVDVKVQNPDGSQALLLNGYRFVASGVTLSLPEATGDQGTEVELALTADNAVGLRAAELTLTFDPAVLTPVDARVGPLIADWTLAPNTTVSGQVRLSLAGSAPASGSGVLVLLRFNVVGTAPASTALTIASAVLNDGALTPQLSHGQFAVTGNWSLAGTVTYFQGGGPVPGVQLDLVGAGVHQATSGVDGTFTLTELPTASYSLLPQKSDDPDGITAYDASLVLQKAAGTLTLDAHQTMAADVNRNGLVSAMDASYILERSVGLLPLPFPGAGQVWDFDPAQRNYSLLSGDQTGQDFTGVLIGDVSGNWGAPPVVAGGEPDPDPVVLSVRRAPALAEGPAKWWLLARIPRAGLHSLDLELAFDEPTAGPALTPQPEALARELVMAANNHETGRLRVGMAGARPVAGLGALLLVTAPDSGPGPLRILGARADEGRVAVRVDADGQGFDQDTDGDRQTDWDEVLSGTNPSLSSSVLGVRRVTLQPDGRVMIEWAAVAGHRYQLQSTEDLAAGAWIDVGPVVTATAASATQTDTARHGARPHFYRVRLVE